MRENTHVRFGGAGRGNGPSEKTAPRPGPIPTDRVGKTIELEADHRAHAQVELVIRDLKEGSGWNHMPSGRFGANAAWVRHEGARDEWLRRLEGRLMAVT